MSWHLLSTSSLLRRVSCHLLVFSIFDEIKRRGLWTIAISSSSETPCFSWVFNFAGEVWSYSLLWQNVKYTLTGCLISISIRNKAFVFAKLLSFLHTFFATFLFHHITLTIHHIARKLFGSSCSELLILWVFREELFSVAVNLCQELTFKITYS